MGDLSPVLAAYLNGFKQQQGLLESAHQIVNQQEARKQESERIAQRDKELKQLDDHFTKQFQLEQDKVEQQRQVHDLAKQMRFAEQKDNILKQFQTGQRQVPQMQANIPQGTPAGYDMFSTIPVSPKTVSINIPGFGDTQFNTNEIDTPEKAMQRDVKKAVGVQDALLPGKIKEATEIEKVKNDGRVNLLEKKLEDQNDRFTRKLEFDKQMNEFKYMKMGELAELRAKNKVNDQLANMGLPSDPAAQEKSIAIHALDRATGREDPNALKGTMLNNLVENYMGSNGLTSFPGGSKGRQNLFDAAGKAQTLVEQFDAMMHDFPPPDNKAGAIGAKIASYVPGTETNKRWRDFESNIIQYAKSQGINSIKMMDSDKEKETLKGALPSPTSDLADWQFKRTKLITNVFGAIQGQISGLSITQRQHIWKDIIDSSPYLKKDPTLEPYLTNAIEKGNFNAK